MDDEGEDVLDELAEALADAGRSVLDEWHDRLLMVVHAAHADQGGVGVYDEQDGGEASHG